MVEKLHKYIVFFWYKYIKHKYIGLYIREKNAAYKRYNISKKYRTYK